MFNLDKQSSVPMYQQLYQALKQEIIQHPEERAPLPAIRATARELCISINTVTQAYQQLLAEGYVYSVPGSGYYRNDMGRTQKLRPTPSRSEQVKTAKTIRYNFQYGNLENKAFPWPRWKECLKEALIQEEDGPQLVYEDKQGLYDLRSAISGLVFQSRGVQCTPDQVVICSGVHDALRLLIALVPAKSYELGFEEPGYSTGRNVFLHNGYTVHPLPVTATGVSMDALVATQCKLIYLTPSHQFPTGHILPIASRNNLLAYIDQADGYLIEDDYDSEFRYRAKPIPSLQSLDNNDRVIYIGTFSKSFTPTIRVAYLVLPRRLLPTYNLVCRDYKTPVATIIQRALNLFIAKGYYARHIRKTVKASEKKYNRIIAMFNESAPKSVRPVATESGVHLMLEFDTPLSEAELLDYLEQQGVRLYPTSHYWLVPGDHPTTLQMGFASMCLEEVEAGLRHLFSIMP